MLLGLYLCDCEAIQTAGEEDFVNSSFASSTPNLSYYWSVVARQPIATRMTQGVLP